MNTITNNDLKILDKKGITQEMLSVQLQFFKDGIDPIQLVRAATIGDGILEFDKDEAIKFASIYQKKKPMADILKFVPASGAATRMFKNLFEFQQKYNPEKQSVQEFISERKAKDLQEFFDNLEKFAFYSLLTEYIKKNPKKFENLSDDAKKHKIVTLLLEEEPFVYGDKPKGLLPFHKHSEKVVTPFEEHFREAVLYASQGEVAHLHFTIAEQHTDAFLKELAEIRPILEKRYQVRFDVTFSCQKPSTDTVAVTETNEFFRDENDKLLFRPAGHGALLKNLAEMTADIIFIKNIDNVVVKNFTDETVFYKEVLAGKLEDVRSKSHKILRQIAKGKVKKKEIVKILDFLKEINIQVPDYVYKFTKPHALDYINDTLNRPIRVCGMVKNEGEPGGGPFWIKDENGVVSLQIVESAQVDLKNAKQAEILKTSTHFNPVDLVCSIKNYKGEVFDLEQFSDPKQGFISEKTYQGRKLKALELPGLWNGAMAHWITLFVEVPLITFNPVKTVNDLLKKTHLG